MKILPKLVLLMAIAYAVLIGLAVKTSFDTAKLQGELAKNQDQYNKLIKLRDVTNTVVQDVAKATPSDPAMKELLARHGINVNPAPAGK